jgi:TPP-dependent pyruvate/acetoin dehydrogenase alpha subunit
MPYFLECRTYRLRAHSMFDAQLYRDKAEIETWRHKDPIVRFQGWLETNRMIHADDLVRIEAEVLFWPKSPVPSLSPKPGPGSQSSN